MYKWDQDVTVSPVTSITASAVSTNAHVNRAAHQWASFQRLPHDGEEVFRRIGQLKELGHSTCEILHGLQSVPPFQCLIRPVQPEKHVNHSGQTADMSVFQGLELS